MIKKLYEKSEIWFAVAWIITYCVLTSVGDNMSASLGCLKSITLPIVMVLSAILYLFVKKNDLSEKYGLCKPQVPAAKVWYYLPLIFLLTVNLWYGAVMNASLVETILYVISMLFIGFLEEIIFRGFLFHAIAKDGMKSAIIISSITFGIGHIMNLFNGSGAELLPNVLQVIYAVAIGFAFVMVYFRTKSLLPCIVTHGLFNAASAFANKAAVTPQRRIASAALITIVAGVYALYMAYGLERNEIKIRRNA